jgi:hypothetical protein
MKLKRARKKNNTLADLQQLSMDTPGTSAAAHRQNPPQKLYNSGF